MSSFTTQPNALQCAPVQEIEPAPELDGARLWARLDALGHHDEQFEYLSALLNLAQAPDDERAVVAAFINSELDAMNAQADDQRRDDRPVPKWLNPWADDDQSARTGDDG